jgi:polar amino acid transport system substrate-binding protein
MKKIGIPLLVLVAVVLFSACAHSPDKTTVAGTPTGLQKILQKGELIVGMTGKQPPLNMKDKEGRVIGLEPELARMMAKAMGVPLKIELMDFFELFPAMESGRIDMILSGMTITPERNLKMAFVGPYFVTGKSFLTKADHIFKCQELCDIDSPQTTLVALKGSTNQQFAEKMIPKAKLILARDYDEAIRLVIEEKADALIADQLTCILAVIRHPREGLHTSLKSFSHEPLGIALSGTDPLLINWVDNFLKTLQGSGDLKKMAEYWIKNEIWEKVPSGEVYKF